MSIKSSVTISLVPEARGGPFVFWDDLGEACRKARALGFDAVEIFPPSASAIDRRFLRSLLDDHGLMLAAVGTGAGWVKGKLNLTLPESFRSVESTRLRQVDHRLSPEPSTLPAIIGSMQGRSTDLRRSRAGPGNITTVRLNELGEHARSEHVPLFYEPLNRYETNMATTIDAGLNVLDRLTTKNVKLLADLFHMNIEETNVALAIERGGRRIGHLHFVDSSDSAQDWAI